MLSAYVGFVRGFDQYREIKGKTLWSTAGEIEQTFGEGLRWVEQHRDERFFLFLHTYQVHNPYEPPPAYDLFKSYEKDGQLVPIDAKTPVWERDRRLYAGEVRYTDAVLDGLLDHLGELGLLDETIVVVTSDHGDEFGEHGLIGHAKTVYDEVMHVPMVLLAPRLVPAGRRIDVPVSLIDLAPTLLDLTGLPVPPAMHGQSLVPLLRGGAFPPSRVLYAEAPPWGPHSGHRVAARTAGFKWIASDDPEVPMLVFDLTTDPGEQAPLDDPQLTEPGARLRARLPRARRHRARRSRPAAPDRRPRSRSSTTRTDREAEGARLHGLSARGALRARRACGPWGTGSAAARARRSSGARPARSASTPRPYLTLRRKLIDDESVEVARGAGHLGDLEAEVQRLDEHLVVEHEVVVVLLERQRLEQARARTRGSRCGTRTASAA